MATPSPRSAILWQNPDKTVTLFDIPCSIVLAQGAPPHPCTAQIYSSPAVHKPYPSTEPKTEKARANVLRTISHHNTNVEFPTKLLQAALSEIANNWGHEWCLQRQVSPFTEARPNRKRRREADKSQPEFVGPSQQPASRPPHSPLSYEAALEASRVDLRDPLDLYNFINPPEARLCPNMVQITNRLIYNQCHYPLHMQHVQSYVDAEAVYVIPPRSSFFLSKINQNTAPSLSMASLTMYPDPSATAGRGQFDFVLLDPPWENRSVKRSSQYVTMPESEPIEALQSILGQHLAPNALVACWITNSASVRATALEAFEAWNVQLIEEWVWLKTTKYGEAVTEIDGIWRKPYEVLLICKVSNNLVDSIDGGIQRRVIAAVPDLHSRKPNLKELIEPMLPANYRALEVFARNLTAGWMAWGDDVLKYNWNGYYI